MPGWSTRAALLRDQRARVDALESQLLSLRRAAAWAGGVVLLALCAPVGLTLREEGPASRVTGAVVSALLLAAALLVLVRHHLRTRRLLAEHRTWSDVDREQRFRALPAGDLDPDLLTVHDVRDDDRLPEVARSATRRAHSRIHQGRVYAVAALLGLVSPLALVPLGGFGTAEGEPLALVVSVVAAVAGLGAVVSAWSGLWRFMRRRQRELNRASLEEQVYLARQRVLHGSEPAPEPPAVPLVARVVAPVAVLLLLGVLAWRIGAASPLALAVSGAVVVVVAVLLVLAVLRQRRPHVVSLLAAGPGLLEAPDAALEVRREAGDLVLSGKGETLRLAAAEVLGVAPVPLAFALAPPAVVVVTAGDPVVVAGRGVDAALSGACRCP